MTAPDEWGAAIVGIALAAFFVFHIIRVRSRS